jgi:hypothetical protein
MNDDEAIPSSSPPRREPWNKGKLIGAKPPLRASHVWSIRMKLQLEKRTRDLALFNLAIDSKLRGCDVVAMRVDHVAPNGYTLDRATIRQRRPVARSGSSSRADAASDRRVSQTERREAWRVPVRRSRWQRLWPHDASICSPGWSVGREHRPRPAQVRHAFTAPNQSDVDLSPNRQSACGAIIVGPHED